MKRCWTIAACLLLWSVKTIAQSEVTDSWKSGSNMGMPSITTSNSPLIDSMHFQLQPLTPQIPLSANPQLTKFTQLTKQGATGINLWNGAAIGFYGMTDQMPGLMTTERGMMTLHQHTGRWSFTASAVANKYWMPWQNTLSTQYGFGGTVGYALSNNVTLNAFGYYYANQMQVGPAMSPYVNNTTYGGYADIRFSKTFGTNVGVKRYLNPMTGKWTTEPIVNPYIKIGDSKLEFPLGSLLKTLVERNRDNPMRFQPRPHTPAQQGRMRR